MQRRRRPSSAAEPTISAGALFAHPCAADGRSRREGDIADHALYVAIGRRLCKNFRAFRTSLFRSLLRGLRAFRVEKIAKNLALLDRLQKCRRVFYTASAQLRRPSSRSAMSGLRRFETSRKRLKFAIAVVPRQRGERALSTQLRYSCPRRQADRAAPESGPSVLW